MQNNEISEIVLKVKGWIKERQCQFVSYKMSRVLRSNDCLCKAGRLPPVFETAL
ncbi:hypothetical protein SAMN05216352_103175 [Alteribacillus bidgolensis]|uniref:Uncharacterized protein n=1 Tax=Alteribacillus bidgolensis TaxID=930129 RepID=A0A1G8G0X6_9BACI|nr:hypothetical protein SAMN05216352_103175 [Alteribacillus bidgolensis]